MQKLYFLAASLQPNCMLCPQHNSCGRQNTPAVLLQRPLAGLNRLPFSPLHVGDIYQRFSGPDAGTVQNVIEFSVPSLLSSRPAVSGTFVVDAKYTVSSSRRIALTFSSANLRECPR